MRTEKKLVEDAAQAVHRVLCSYRYDLCPHNEPLPRDRAAANAALTTAQVPQMLKVVAAWHEIDKLVSGPAGFDRDEIRYFHDQLPQTASMRIRKMREAVARLDPS